MTENLNSCLICKYLQDACHKLSFCRKPGLKSLADLDDYSCELLLLRSGLKDTDLTELSVCFHHEKMFLVKFEQNQKVL